jgi:hypothetical protein
MCFFSHFWLAVSREFNKNCVEYLRHGKKFKKFASAITIDLCINILLQFSNQLIPLQLFSLLTTKTIWTIQ